MNEIVVPPAFSRQGPPVPALPVIISVPHAGRYYSPALLADAVSPATLRLLEDRFVDLLITEAVDRGASAFVAEHARAWIDLNRDPREIDAAMLSGPPPSGLIHSARTRHGLGLIPRRIGDSVNLWRRRFEPGEVEDRIRRFHTPYHQAIAEALAAARARFGVAVLIDCHSMPPIRRDLRDGRPMVVIGDRFGQSAAALLGDLIEEVARKAGFRPARNAPYAGGYSLDLHGKPRGGIHALQIEIDRSCYLDRSLEQPGDGLGAARALVTEIFDALCIDLSARHAIAAE